MNLRLKSNSPSTAAAGDVSGTDHHVMIAHAGENRGDEAGRMAEVGVEVQEIVESVLDRVFHRLQDRRAESELAGAVDHVDARQARGDLVGELAGAVGRVVVDDQHRSVRRSRIASTNGRKLSSSLYVASVTSTRGGPVAESARSGVGVVDTLI